MQKKTNIAKKNMIYIKRLYKNRRNYLLSELNVTDSSLCSSIILLKCNNYVNQSVRSGIIYYTD